MSDASEVKPQYLWFCQKSGWQVTSFDPNEDEAIGFSGRKDTRLFINKETHDRIVAELKAEIRAARTLDALVADNAQICEQHDEIEKLEATIARQARVIEKLKLAVTDIANKNTCWRLYEVDKYKSYEDGWEGVAEFAGIVLNELEAIEEK